MSHVAVDVGEDRMSAPWRHQQAEGEGEGKPVRGEEVGLCWLAEGPGGVRLDEAIGEND